MSMNTSAGGGTPVGSPPAPPVLEIRGLAKSFDGVRALDGVDLAVASGEIHGLLGQNGSGKSTLIKVLAGFHDPDAGGELRVNGTPVSLPLVPGEFQRLGMRFVHQDLGLINSLSVLENLNVAHWSTSKDWSISWREARRRARDLFETYGLRLDPRTPVGDLRPVQRAMLAIVRALSTMPTASEDGRGLLVLDEPTVFLPEDDTQLLFDLTRRVAGSGAGVLFVSHDLDEVLALTDRVTVLRDGRVAGTATTSDSSADELVELIVGHAVDTSQRAPRSVPSKETTTVQISGAAGGLVKSADLTIRAGEILGVTGLSGAGFEDLPYLLFGVGLATAGSMQVGTHALALPGLTPLRASRSGVALVPADRHRDGAILSLSVLDNVSMQMLSKARRGVHLRRRVLRDLSLDALRNFDVRPADPALQCSSLSGGNQQKVLMAKWLQNQPAFLIVHEPTQGVDVGAREEIYRVVREAAEGGMAVLCASSDHEQLAALCDRVIVFRQGRVGPELSGGDLRKQTISQACFASAQEVESSAIELEPPGLDHAPQHVSAPEEKP